MTDPAPSYTNNSLGIFLAMWPNKRNNNNRSLKYKLYTILGAIMTLIKWKLKFTLLQQHLRSPINEAISGFEEESEKERKIHCLSSSMVPSVWTTGLWRFLLCMIECCISQSCLLMDRGKISNLYRGPSIDASYQVSVHLAEGFQRRRWICES
jgi:hypothetical protein